MTGGVSCRGAGGVAKWWWGGYSCTGLHLGSSLREALDALVAMTDARGLCHHTFPLVMRVVRGIIHGQSHNLGGT